MLMSNNITFYTRERWENWLKEAAGSTFKLEEDTEEVDPVFVNMMDDVVLAALKVLARYERKKISQADALSGINDIKEIVMSEAEPVNDDVDMMIQSLQSSLLGALSAYDCYIQEGYNKKDTIKKLVGSAVEAEEEDPEKALEYMSKVGAMVINGKKLPANLEVPYGFVAEWIDGIDAISAAMVGDTGYKDDDGSS
ncbi:MAG: DUF2150 family protein [Methanosarcinales archaeon]|nr:DUF2150 family protein [Methanosarcinales archaeon]